MSLNNAMPLLEEWQNSRHNPILCKDVERKITNIVKENIEAEIAKYSQEDVLKAMGELQDMFTLYEDIKKNNETIVAKKIEYTSMINKMHKRKAKWGLTIAEQEQFFILKTELENIDLQLSVYNHVVNFSIPKALSLYLDGKESYKLNYLLEIYKYIVLDEMKLNVAN